MPNATQTAARAEPVTLEGQEEVSASVPSMLSVTKQEDGAAIVFLNGKQLSEASWGRCKLLVEMLDDCDEEMSDVRKETTIPIPPEHVSLWLAAGEGRVSSKDTGALCKIVKVCHSVTRPALVAALVVLWLLVAPTRNTLIHKGTEKHGVLVCVVL